MERRGETFCGRKLWAKREVEILKRHHPDYATIKRLLPNRSMQAIYCAAFIRSLPKPRRVWTREKISQLRRLARLGLTYRAMAEMMGVTFGSIDGALRKYSIQVARPVPQVAENPLVHAVRQRAFEFGLSINELRAFVGGGSFGARGRTGLIKVRKAVRILDGKLIKDTNGARIVWND
jgi:hypothetical protein